MYVGSSVPQRTLSSTWPIEWMASTPFDAAEVPRVVTNIEYGDDQSIGYGAGITPMLTYDQPSCFSGSLQPSGGQVPRGAAATVSDGGGEPQLAPDSASTRTIAAAALMGASRPGS